MKKMSETIVFFGSGPVAARSLEMLADNFSIEAVVTKPKPPHHKDSFPVIDTAESLGIPVITATNKKELSNVISQQNFRSRLAVLIDFGIIVAQDVIDTFPLGIVNSHFSLLPEWRGADPITFAILSGQKQTGVSLMLLVEAMDEGPLLSMGVYDLPDNITAPALTDGLIKLSDALLTDTLPKYLSREIEPADQEKVAGMTGRPTEPTYSRKLTKQDGVIDWHKPAVVIEREIRAFSEWPKSKSTIAGKDVIITKARAQAGTRGTPGEFFSEHHEIGVYCGENALIIERLKPAGKAEMTAEAFLAGYTATNSRLTRPEEAAE